MTALGFLLLIAVVAFPAAILMHRGSRDPGRTGPGLSPRVAVAGLVPLLALFFLLQSAPEGVGLLGLAVIVMLVVLWVRELVTLMGLGDEAFPGRFDKVLWFALLVLLPPIGVPAFAIFRRAYWPVEKPVKDISAHDLA